MPYRVRGKEVQILRGPHPVGWRTLEVFESRAAARKHLLALLRAYARESPAPASSPQEKEGLPVAEVAKPVAVVEAQETPTTTPQRPTGPEAWYPVGVGHWMGLDADSRPWVAWPV